MRAKPSASFKMQNAKFKILILVLGIALVVSLAGNIWLTQKNKFNSLTGSVNSSLAQPVLAEEIYPLFLCPCCGKPLDPNNICCEMAKEMLNYIDSLVKTEKSEKDIILAFVKKYGLNSFVDENKGREFKEELAKTAPEERPIISLSPASYDFGNVSLKKGVVFTFFELKNEGKKDLVIDRLDTSCGCTSAAIVFQQKEGPRFAMAGHGINSPTDWKITIPPGQTGQLKVYYDPNVHPDFRGFAIREIYVYSNDPIDFEKKVQVELNQVD